MKKLLILSVCAVAYLIPGIVQAWQPSGYVWMDHPYAWDHNNTKWYYFSESDSLYYQDLTSGSWRSVTTASGWHWFVWPYSYSYNNSRWNYWSETDQMYVMDWNTRQWSRFGAAGQSGDVQVSLTWNTTADLDLYVTEPSGEVIWYSHRTSATGGQLDVDDTNGYGPENIFWPVGSAPPGQYSVTVKHYSGSLPTTYRVTVTVDGSSSDYSGTLTSSKEEDFITDFSVGETPPRVLLLLHGMNANVDSWQDFVQSEFGNRMGRIEHGTLHSIPQPDASGVYCYEVDFGWYDASSGRTGVPDPNPRAFRDAHAPTEDAMGDFSSFGTLGLEVWEAVHYVLSVHPGAEITLLGHSRGGLAARAFLQEAQSNAEKASVVGLLTTGSPHRGSRLGRVYQYLVNHPRAQSGSNGSEDDWEVVDDLMPYLDVRKPTIGDLADNSSAIAALSGSVGNLPNTISFGAIRYSGENLGQLHDWWNIFDGNWALGLGEVSQQGEDYILGVGNDKDDFPGDGIVPYTSQRYDDLSGFPGSGSYRNFSHTGGGVLHTEETEQVNDMRSALRTMLNWWN